MGPHALDLAPFLVRLATGLAAGAITWIIAVDYGVALISRFTNGERGTARLGVGAALGYALLGSMVALLGLVHEIHLATIWGLLFVAVAARLPIHLRRLRTLPEQSRRLREWFQSLDYSNRAAVIVIAMAALTSIVAAALPATLWDPVAYHLPLASAALAHGSFVFTSSMVQSGFPQLGEAAALPAYAIAGSAGAAMATLGAGLCLSLVVCAFAQRLAVGSGLCAAMLVMSCGLWLWLAPSFYVDVPFAMFVVAAGLEAFSHASAASVTARACIIGALCGAAAAVKYSGLGAGLVIWIALMVLAPRNRWRAAAAFLGAAALVAGAWYIRGIVVSGDPLYPFLSAQFAAAPSDREFAARYVDMTRHWCGGGTWLTDLLSLPYRLIAQPRSFCGDPGIALRAGVIFAIAALVWVRSTLGVGLLTLALTLGWFTASQQWRFALAPLSLYAAIVAAGTSALGARLRPVAVLAFCALGAYGVLLNWMPFTRSEAPQSIVPAVPYITGKETASQYLDSRLETFAVAQWLTQHGVPGREILALDDVRDYYFPRGTTWGNPFYEPSLSVDWQAPMSARYDQLRRLGFRYMVVNANIAYTHRTPTGVDWSALREDERNGLSSVFRANDVTVFDLATTPTQRSRSN